MPESRESRQYGFTLTELLVVIAIVGIIISLILVAARDGVRRAEERQTQALITKLEAALSDRVDALLASTPPINQTHRYLAALTYKDPNNNNSFSTLASSIDRRAQVIAILDYLKAELPDVFFINSSKYVGSYPLNFAAAPYPLSNPNGVVDFSLPLGNAFPGAPISVPNGSTITQYIPTPGFSLSSGVNNVGMPAGGPPTPLAVIAANTGIFGASYTAAAGVTKNLYEAAALDMIAANPGITVNTKAGYDAADNNINGLVDDMLEVTTTGSPSDTFSSYVAARLAHHTHATARSETLYGVLVEGQGPLGSVFNREDFTSRDVADTDGDGMLEFIDAWGQPLQFYRWPIYYGTNTAYSAGTADSQKGFGGYATTETRQQDPLDPNQLLVAPAWWDASNIQGINPGMPAMATSESSLPTFPSNAAPFNGSPATQQANAIMLYFKILIDPGGGGLWDRTGKSYRREYYSKFLVLSGGPDQVPGTYMFTNPNYPTPAFPTGNLVNDTLSMNWCESQAAQVDFSDRSGVFFQTVTPTAASTNLQQNYGGDDISNQALQGPGAGSK